MKMYISTRIYISRLFLDGSGSSGLEGASESLFRRSGDEFGNGEFDFVASPLKRVSSSDIFFLGKESSSNNVDGFMSSSVSATHFNV